jgi:hypothetical protein
MASYGYGKTLREANGLRLLSMALLAVGAGCIQLRQTDPARTATEQLLLSTAADRAFGATSFYEFTGKRVFLDTNYFESYDAKYALGTIRDMLSQAGAKLVERATNSEITLELRSGALSTDDRTALLGIPSTGLPIPFVGTVMVPEISLYKSQKQYSTAKLALFAYTTGSREHVFSSGPLVGKAYDNYLKILIFSHHATDVPEMREKKSGLAN